MEFVEMFKQPFSVFAGENFGTLNSSLSSLGDVLPSRSLGQAKIDVGANVANGNLFIRDHHKTLTDRGLNIDIGYVYNHQAKTPWTLAAAKSIGPLTGTKNTAGSTVTLIEKDGHETVYTYNATTQTYLAVGGEQGNRTLTANTDGTWSYHEIGSGVTGTFNTTGKETTRIDAQGRGLSFTYDSSNRLTAITGESGQQVTIDYVDATHITVSQVVGQTTTPLMQYELDSSGNLLTTTTPIDSTTNYTTTYQYTGGALTGFTQDDTTAMSFAFDSSNRLTSIVDGEKRASTLAYTSGQATVTDALKNVTTFDVNASDQLTAVRKPTVAGTAEVTQYAYDATTQRVSSITRPNAAATSFAYDAQGLLQTTTNAVGNKVDTYHDQTTGALIAQTIYEGATPTPLTSYFVYNSSRQLVYTITPMGAVKAFNYDADGNLASTRLFLSGVIDTSTFTPATAVPKATVDTWIATQDITQTQLNAFEYNDQGLMLQSNAYATLDASGNGVSDDQMGQEVFTYNVFGQVLTKAERQSSTVTNTTTSTYDGLQRLTSKIDALGNATATSYTANQTATTKADGLVETKSVDASGLLASLTESNGTITRTTTYKRDAAGRKATTTHPDQQQTTHTFDPQNREVKTTKANGDQRQTAYDDLNTIIHETEVAKASNGATATSRKVSKLYDLAERLQYEVDGAGVVTEILYDTSNNRRIGTIKYATPLASEEPRATDIRGALPIVKSVDDEYNYDFLDSDSHKIAHQDAEGYVEALSLNVAGKPVTGITYATPVAMSADWATVKASLKPDATADATDYYYHDLKGQKSGSIDAGDALTVINRSANGLVNESIAYATAVNPASSTKLSDLIPATNTEDHSTSFTYDQLNRQTKVVESDASSEGAVYDSMGRKTHEYTSDENDSKQTRSFVYSFDEFGQITSELTPRAAASIAALMLDERVSGEDKDAALDKVRATSSITHTYDDTGLRLTTTDPYGNRTVFYYNSVRQLVVSVDADGGIVQNTYNDFDQVAEERCYETACPKADLPKLTGGFLTTALQTQLTQLQTAGDSITVNTYDPRGLKTTVVDPEKYTHSQTFDAFRRCTEEIKPVDATRNLTTARTFTKRGLLATETEDPTGLKYQESYTYNAQRAVTSKTDKRGGVHTYTRDVLGRATSYLSPVDQGKPTPTWKKTWDAFRRVLTKTDALGRVTTYAYDQTKRQEQEISPLKRVKTFVKNAFNQVIEKIHPSGATQSTEYDLGGSVESEKDVLDQTTSQAFNLNGWKTSHTDAAGLETDYSHTSAGHLSSEVVDPTCAKLTTSYENNAQGRVIDKENPGGTHTAYVRNKKGQVSLVAKDPQTTANPNGLNVLTLSTLNADGSASYERQGDLSDLGQRETKTETDILGRTLATIVDPDGLAITYQIGYDAANNVVSKTDPNGNVERSIFDLDDQLCYEVNAKGGVIQYDYDSAGQKTAKRNYYAAIDPTKLSDTSSISDIAGLVQVSNTLDDVDYYLYDDDGCECYTVNQLGIVTQKFYDVDGHVVKSIIYDAPIPAATLTNLTMTTVAQAIKPGDLDKTTYSILDAKGQSCFELEMIDATQASIVQKTFDADGHCTQETAYAQTIDATKLTDFNLKTVEAAVTPLAADPLKRSDYYLYDNLGRLIYHVERDLKVKAFGYNDNGTMTSEYQSETAIILPTSITLTTIAAAVKAIANADIDTNQTHALDALDRKTGTTHQVDSKTTLEEGFTHDALSQLRSHTDKNGEEWTTGWDSAGRKTSLTSPEFDAGAIEQAAAGGLSLTLQPGVKAVTTYAYDDAGNQTGITYGSGTPEARTLSFTYDATHKPTGTSHANVAVDDPTITPDPVMSATSAMNRPEKTVTITTTAYYNPQGNISVEQNESGAYQFHIYDQQQRLAYVVDYDNGITAYKRNSLNKAVEVTRYANPMSKFTPATYATTGISITDLQQYLVPDAVNDRTATMIYSRQGLKVEVDQPERFMYIPNVDGADDYGVEVPKAQWVYNAFKEVVEMHQLQNPFASPVAWNVTYKKRDAKGRVGAKVSPMGYLDIDTYHTSGHKAQHSEYATALTGVDLATASIADLAAAVKPSDADREMVKTYDGIARVTTLTTKNVTCQAIIDSSTKEVADAFDPSKGYDFSDQPKQDLTTTFAYLAENKAVQVTDSQGRSRFNYYGPLKHLIMSLSIPRDSVDVNGAVTTYTPVEIHEINVHGNIVGKTRYQNCTGTPTLTAMPTPTADGSQQTTLNLFNTMGKIIVSQTPMGALLLQTYAALRKVARTYQWVTAWEQTTPKQAGFTTSKLLRQEALTYNASGVEIQRALRKLDGTMDLTVKVLNMFGEEVTEGDSPTNQPLVRRFDNTGHPWISNEHGGFAAISLCDAVGNESSTIRSLTQDLSQLTPADLPALIEQDFTKRQLTTVVRDADSHIIQQTEPSFRETQAEPLMTSMLVGKAHPEFGVYSFSIPEPAIRSMVGKLQLWKAGTDESTATTYDLTLNNERWGTDLSALDSDLYNYRLAFYKVDPQTNTTAKNAAELAQATIQIITANNNNTQSLLITEIDSEHIQLGGNTSGVVGIEVIPYVESEKSNSTPKSRANKAKHKKSKEETDLEDETFKLAVRPDPGTPGALIADFKGKFSGRYTCKPIMSMTPVGPEIGANQTGPDGTRLTIRSPFLRGTYEGSSGMTTNVHWADLPEEFDNNQVHLIGIDTLNPTDPTRVVDFPLTMPSARGGSFNTGVCLAIVSLFASMTDNNGEVWTFNSTMDGNPDPFLPVLMSPLCAPDVTKGVNPVLYFYPSSSSAPIEALNMMNQGSCTGTLPLQPWMNGGGHINLAGINTQDIVFQPMGLGDSAVDAIETQPFTISTSRVRSLHSRVIPFTTTTDAFYKDYSHVNYEHQYESTLATHWTLPSDLQLNRLQINYEADMSSANYPVTLGLGRARGYGVDNNFQDYVSLPGITGFGPQSYGLCSDLTNVSVTLFMANGDQIPLLTNIMPTPTTLGSDSTAFKANPSYTFYVSGFPANVASVTVEYLDVSLSDDAVWVAINNFNYYGHSAAGDVSSLTDGIYPYRLQAKDSAGNLVDLSSVADVSADGYVCGELTKKAPGENVLLSTPVHSTEPIITPVRKQDPDRWDNALSTTDPVKAGNDFTYNRHNQMLTQTGPAVDVVNDDNSRSKNPIRPVIGYGYNERGELLGRRSARGYARVVFRNAAGKKTVSVDPDRVYTGYQRDGFSREIGIMIPHSATVNTPMLQLIQAFDLDNNPTSSTDALSQTSSVIFNERKKRIGMTDPKNNMVRLGYDERDNIVQTWQPLGQLETQAFDRNKQQFTLTLANGQTQSWGRDFFGNLLQGTWSAHTDFSGAQYWYEMNGLGQITLQKSQDGQHGNQYDPTFTNRSVKTPDQAIQRFYNEAGYEIYEENTGDEVQTANYYDALHRAIGTRFRDSEGNILQDVSVNFNAMGWMTDFLDTQVAMHDEFDLDGNHRQTKAWYFWNNAPKASIWDAWFTYTNAGTMLIYEGSLNASNQVVIIPGQGMQLGYNFANWRNQEITITAAGVTLTNTIGYFSNGLLQSEIRTDGLQTSLVYDAASHQIQMTRTTPSSSSVSRGRRGLFASLPGFGCCWGHVESAFNASKTTVTIPGYDDNGWLISSSLTLDGKPQNKTLFHNDESNYLTHQHTDYTINQIAKHEYAQLIQGRQSLKGLLYEKVPGDGDCLYHTVSLYLGWGVSFLRGLVADYLTLNFEEFYSFRENAGSKEDFREYIEAVRHGHVWGKHIDIEILQRLMSRPIIVISANANPVIPDNIDTYTGSPIFVYFNQGMKHYDALLVKDGCDARTILRNMRDALAEGQPVLYNHRSGVRAAHKDPTVCDDYYPKYLGFDNLFLYDNTGTRKGVPNRYSIRSTPTSQGFPLTTEGEGKGAMREGFRAFQPNSSDRIVTVKDGEGKETFLVYDPAGNPLGYYGQIKPDAQGLLDPPPDVNFDVNVKSVAKKIPTPSKIIADGVRTFNEIAVFLGKSISEAPAIARASNYPAVNTATFVPPQNTPITIPASTNAEDDADDHAPYNESAIDVRLNPHMPMPLIRIKPPHRHIPWWKKDLIIGLDVAMSVALALAIPGAGAELAGAGADLLEDVLADAIVGAAFSAASSIGAQGLNEVTGLSNGLDMTDVMWSSIDGAVSAGGAEGFGLNLPGLQVSSELTASTLENVEKLAILQTAFLYATGQTKTFEWKQLAVTLMSTLANAGANRFASKMISNQSLWTQQLMANSLKGAANEGISEVMFGSAPTAESAAVNALGITLGQGLVRESELAFGGSGFANHSTVLSHKRLARTLDEQEARSLDNAFGLKNYGVQTNAFGAAIAGQGQPAFVNQGHLGPANDARFADRVKAATSTTARALADETRAGRMEVEHLRQERVAVGSSTRMMRAAQHSSWMSRARSDMHELSEGYWDFKVHAINAFGSMAIDTLEGVGRMAENAARLASGNLYEQREAISAGEQTLYHLGLLSATMFTSNGAALFNQMMNSPQAQAFYGRLTSGNAMTRIGAYGTLFGGAAFAVGSAVAGGGTGNLGDVAAFEGAAADLGDSENLDAATIAKHPLDGWTPEQVVQYVNQLGLKTPRDQLILWSGLGRGDEGVRLSQEYADLNGGMTLEMTRGGKWLHKLDLFDAKSPFTPQEATEIWANVSRKMTQEASGQVRALLGQVRPRSIYTSQETLELYDNPKVLGVDEVYLKPKFQFGNN
jgi:YD repeat-containing protein